MVAAVFLALVLFVVSAFHLIWAAGFAWPCADRHTLMRTVVGNPDLRDFPSAGLTLAAALAIAAAGVFALFAGGIFSVPQPRWLLTGGLAVLTMIFLARGLSSYTLMRVWSRPCEPFATLDRRYFAPLCILLGAGFGWLLWHSVG